VWLTNMGRYFFKQRNNIYKGKLIFLIIHIFRVCSSSTLGGSCTASSLGLAFESLN